MAHRQSTPHHRTALLSRHSSAALAALITTAMFAISVQLAPTVEAAPSADPTVEATRDASCTFAISDAWPEGGNGNVGIVNDGDRAITSWTVRITVGSRSLRLWSAAVTDGDSGSVTAADLGWNGTVDAGMTATVAGGSLTGSGLSVGDELACRVLEQYPDPAKVSCSFTLTDVWSRGGYGRVEITNDDTFDVTGWTVRLSSHENAISVFGADVVEDDPDAVTVTNRSWNRVVPAQSTASPTPALVRSTEDVVEPDVDCAVVDVT